MDGVEAEIGKGLFAHACSTLYCADIQDYGYERFEALVGINGTKRASGDSSVEFLVYADGELVWRSGEMRAADNAKEASVDLSGVHVLKLVADSLGANASDHAVRGNASFVKGQPTPYLSATAKEFADPFQVTSSNILEGVFARTLSGPLTRDDKPIQSKRGFWLYNGKEGNDLSDRVTYTTDYVEGATGEFSVTYTVVDEAGYTRSRTVPLTVAAEDYLVPQADLEYLTTPRPSFMYAGRDYFDEQGKAAFDLVVETLLRVGYDADRYPLVTNWGERVAKVDVNLQDAGIFMRVDQAKSLASVLMDDEPRMFHVKDWGTSVSQKDGMANVVTFYVPERYVKNDYYHQRLLATERNASRFLSQAQPGMTDAQRLRAVLQPYGSWIKYIGGGQLMDEALADGKGVCGGNARGAIYLAQRTGVKAYWVRTGSHAWSMMKLNSTGQYYQVDMLAYPGAFLARNNGDYRNFHGHHDQVNFDRSLGYPDASFESYPYAWTAWPNVSLAASQDVAVLMPRDRGSFDPKSLLVSCSSIYDGDLSDAVVVDDGGLESSAGENGYAEGLYEIAFAVTDSRGNEAAAKGYVQVVGEGADASALPPASNGGASVEDVSLWTGAAERPYADGLRMNEARSITYNVEGGGFTYFDAWVGVNGSVRANTAWGSNGKVQLEVLARVRNADGTMRDEPELIAQSPIMGWYAPQHHILVKLPENAVEVTLRNVPKGSGNNHAAWGNPRFLAGDVLGGIPTPPVVTGVEDGAVYEEGVAPLATGAESVELYRRELPTIIDPDTGEEVDAAPDGAGAAADAVAEDPSTSAAVFAKGAAPAAIALEDSPSVEDYGELVADWKNGEMVTREGRYTLVAKNAVGQTAMARFQVGVPQPVDPVPPDTEEPPLDPEDPAKPDNPDPGNPGEPVDPGIDEPGDLTPPNAEEVLSSGDGAGEAPDAGAARSFAEASALATTGDKLAIAVAALLCVAVASACVALAVPRLRRR